MNYVDKSEYKLKPGEYWGFAPQPKQPTIVAPVEDKFRAAIAAQLMTMINFPPEPYFKGKRARRRAEQSRSKQIHSLVTTFNDSLTRDKANVVIR